MSAAGAGRFAPRDPRRRRDTPAARGDLDAVEGFRSVVVFLALVAGLLWIGRALACA